MEVIYKFVQCPHTNARMLKSCADIETHTSETPVVSISPKCMKTLA